MERKLELGSLGNVPERLWSELGEKRIYFAHQSVGNNIIDGMQDLMEENPEIKLHIVESGHVSALAGAAFAHSRVGRNDDPLSKIDDFARYIEGGIGDKADIAFFKFCYVDVDADTDVEELFAGYKGTMARLKREYSGTTFIHVTVPLCTSKTTWKTWIKKLMGKKDMWEYVDNIKRNEFNQLVLGEYGGKEPVFDLAGFESVLPDGRRSFFRKGGKTYYSLAPDYTHDGGHLNEMGRRKVAEQLLILLTKEGNRRQASSGTSR